MIRLRLLLLALSACAVSQSFGALGDSIDAAFKRYGNGGQRVHYSVWEGHKKEVIRWDHWFSPNIEVSFDNGTAFRVRIEGNITPSKWDYYLQMNSQGQKWTLLTWSAGEDSPAEWRREDGAHALYFQRVFHFFNKHDPEVQEPPNLTVPKSR